MHRRPLRRRLLGRLPDAYRGYPLSHDLFVVEIGLTPSLLDDPGVRAQVPRRAWLWVERLGMMRSTLGLASVVKR